MFKSILVLAALSIVSARSARAEEGTPPSTNHAEPTVAITWSPLHMFVPMVELTAEVRVAPKLGVAVIGGAGRFHDQDTNMPVSLFEGGASARYYVTGSFRTGLQIGAEALYLKAKTDAQNVDVKAAGLALSPFIGYKWTHGSGLTLEGALGASFMVAQAKADTGQMASASKIGPMLNLDVGYSF